MGKTIGSGDLKLAKLYSKKLQKLFVFMGIICGVLLFFIRLKPLPAFSGNQRNGQYISYDLKCGDGRNVLSDAYQWRHYPWKWQYCLFHEGGSDQYLGDCDPIIYVYGICGQSITGHCGVLP